MADSSFGPPPKVARLDCGWEDKILAAKSHAGTLPDSAMPFVNRHSEVFQLLEENVHAVITLSTREVTDFRGLKVCFAAQMFGSGKTTLGMNFVRQLGSEEFKDYANTQLEGKEESYVKEFRAEWERAKTARTIYMDLGGRSAVGSVPGILAEMVKVAVPVDADVAEGIAKVIFSQGRSTEPLFVHIDEIGGFGEGVRILRDGIRCVWQKMNAQRQQGMPHIYFYLSGKGVPLTALGSTTSPVGTKWIILDVLEERHIKVIREKMLPGSSERLDLVLHQWTGGAPRLLLYALRALHHLGQDLRDPNLDLDDVMSRTYTILEGIPAVRGDIFVDDRAKEFHESWLHLMVLGQLRVPCRREMKLHAGTAVHSIEQLLGRLNVYIAKEEGADTFRVHIFKLVERFVRTNFMEDCRVPLLFRDVQSTAAELLERLVEQRIIIHACLVSEDLTWKQLAQPLLDGSKFGSRNVALDRRCPLVVVPGVNDSCGRLSAQVCESDLLDRASIHSGDLGTLIAKVRSNRIYRPRSKSGSADTFVKQSDFLLEIQDKSGVASGLSLADVVNEVGKCVESGDVVLLFIALKLNVSLARWVGDGVLTLAPGTYQEKQGSNDGPLLYKPCGANAWSQQIASGAMSLAEGGAVGKHVQLLVRKGLEVVVPSPAAVRQFLGDADFEVVRKLASNQTAQVDVPFISRFYGFSVQPRDVLSPQGVEFNDVELAQQGLQNALQGVASAQRGLDFAMQDLEKAWKEDNEAKIDKAKAEVDKAKAEVDKAKAEVDKAKAEVKNAKAEVEKAKAEVEKAKAAQ